MDVILYVYCNTYQGHQPFFMHTAFPAVEFTIVIAPSLPVLYQENGAGLMAAYCTTPCHERAIVRQWAGWRQV